MMDSAELLEFALIALALAFLLFGALYSRGRSGGRRRGYGRKRKTKGKGWDNVRGKDGDGD